jgi:hypothetical protein
MSDELTAAFRRTEALGNEKIDRRNWTPKQWSDDAERIMNHIDGASSALLNGHVNGLLKTIKTLRRELEPRQITTVEELDALPVGSVVLHGGRAFQHYPAYPAPFDEYQKWKCGDGGFVRSTKDGSSILPATVLYEPQP